MAKTSIGVICGAITGRIYAVINPSDDKDLDNPRWLLIQIGEPDDAPERRTEQGEVIPRQEREPIVMQRIPVRDYMKLKSHAEMQGVMLARMGIKAD